MARTLITAIAIDADGYNLTDSSEFATLATGAGNGVEFAYNQNTLIALKNDSGGAAVFTIKVPTPAAYAPFSLTLDDLDVPVANGKTWVIWPAAIFRQTDGRVYVDCDVAGKLMVVGQ